MFLIFKLNLLPKTYEMIWHNIYRFPLLFLSLFYVTSIYERSN